MTLFYIAQLVEPYELFFRYGLLGVIVGWILFRLEGRMASIEHKLIGLNRTLLIELLSRETISFMAKKMAEAELEKLNRPTK